MIKKESISKVIDRADIVEVVGQFINLKKRGSNYIGLCPFHNEKTPSFNINPARGIYKCFGCGKGGDVVSFIEEYEKYSFTEAIRWLANFYHIELEETEVPDEYKQQQKIEESLRIVNDFAANYFHNNLSGNEEGKIVGKGYFIERGFTDQTIEKFKLGYCLDSWDAFTQHALASGYNAEILEKAGLIKNNNGKLYDNYKGRAIFPILSNTGKILGFGARILKKNDKAPKYVNSPENEIYVKNKVLYGLYHARQAIRQQDECLLVEGYADVISLSQGGVENVVASSGTSLTEGQLRLISNLSKNLTFLYDGDAAGIKAALRGLDMALAQGFRVKLVLLPQGEDPDDFMQKNGAQAFNEYIATHKKDVIDFYLELGLKDAANDPVKKNDLVNEIAETISHLNRIEDFSLQEDYIRNSAEKLNISQERLINLVNTFVRNRIQKEQRKVIHDFPEGENDFTETPVQSGSSVTEEKQKTDLINNKTEWQILKVLLAYGNRPYENNETVAYYIYQNFSPNIFSDALARKVFTEYHEYWTNNGQPPEEDFFIKHTDKSIRHKAVDIFYEKHEPNKGWSERYRIETPHGDEIYIQEVRSSFSFLKLREIRKHMEENEKRMKTETDEKELMKLIRVHVELKKKEKELMSIVIF